MNINEQNLQSLEPLDFTQGIKSNEPLPLKGITDIEGINPNPLNNEPFSQEYKDLAQVWSKLPAYEKLDDIYKSIVQNQITFIVSGTGSGKTVLVPKIALHYLNYDGRIAICLPKRVITKTAATYAAQTLDVQLGKQVGYIYKGSEKEMNNPSNKLQYMTDGILMIKFLSDINLTDYNVIIIDELHERKLNIDLILLFLKSLLESGRRPDLKVILMSATIDVEKYEKYFSGIKFNALHIVGRTNYPVDIQYLDYPTQNYLEQGLTVIENLLLNEKLNNQQLKDMLFFITSSSEAKETCQTIKKKFASTYCVEVYSDMPETDKVYAESLDKYKELGDYTHKLIMATNVAESSLTIKGLTYVIDSCYELHSRFDPKTTAYTLDRQLISKAQAMQRSGRVGRTGTGVCYRLLTYEQFKQLKPYPEPEILREDLSIDLLKIVAITPQQTFDQALGLVNAMIDIPKQTYITYSYNIYTLYRLIDSNDKLTKIGYAISTIPLPLNRCLFLIYAYQLYCAKEAAIIVAMIEILAGRVTNLFYPSKEDKDPKPGELLKNLVKKRSDHLTYLQIFKQYKDSSDRKTWAKKYGSIRLDLLGKVETLSNTYYYRLVNLDLRFEDNERKSLNIAKTDINKRILLALKMSHQHQTAKKFQSIYADQKMEANIKKDSMIVYAYKRKELVNKKFIYDEFRCVEGRCEFSVVSLI
jgi:pre-mRNA-splicing factor ATP-dependent RNA helicase DHX15/PRP43